MHPDEGLKLGIRRTVVLALLAAGSALAHAKVVSLSPNPIAHTLANSDGFNEQDGLVDPSWVDGPIGPRAGAPATPDGIGKSHAGTDPVLVLTSPGTYSFDEFGIYADSGVWGNHAAQPSLDARIDRSLMESLRKSASNDLSRPADAVEGPEDAGIAIVPATAGPREHVLLSRLAANDAVAKAATLVLAMIVLVALSLGMRRGRRSRKRKPRS